MLFTDDQVITQDATDKLQLSVHKLYLVSSIYNIKMLETKTMPFPSSQVTQIFVQGTTLQKV